LKEKEVDFLAQFSSP